MEVAVLIADTMVRVDESDTALVDSGFDTESGFGVASELAVLFVGLFGIGIVR